MCPTKIAFWLTMIFHSHPQTRWVDGTPTTEVTPVTIWLILTPDLGHKMVKVINDLENSNIKVMAKGKPIVKFEA